MKRSWLIAAALAAIALVAVIVVLTAVFTPEETNPAYAAALAFAQAAGRGDDETAHALLDDAMLTFARDTCPEGRVSLCVEGYIPDAWGAFQSVVFRRAAPDPGFTRDGQAAAYDVDLIATYAEGVGFSGVCIHERVERAEDGAWRVAGYAGFVACGDAASRNMASNPDAPNRAP